MSPFLLTFNRPFAVSLRSVRAAILLLALALLITASSVTLAQDNSEWSTPQRLSSLAGRAGRAEMVADDYGFVHAVWTEQLSEDEAIIQYASFDGQRWSDPVDIYVTEGFESSTVRLTIDPNQQLHMVWQEGGTSPTYYMTADAHDALASSARVWSEPLIIPVSSFDAVLHVDEAGVMHLVYSNFFGSQPGVFYTYSVDNGDSWSLEHWFDPDIPEGNNPLTLNFVRDVDGTMHVSWLYVDTTVDGVPGRWIRYSRSSDNGSSWSTPETIDRDPDSSGRIRAASPVMAAANRQPHIVWAGGDLPYRNHAWQESSDVDWRTVEKIPSFSELHGQAFDALVADSRERIHFLGQIRFPEAIYHAIWEGGVWQRPQLVYPISNGIHAHNLAGVFRQGKQLVITFTDSPTDDVMRLYSMSRTLDDLPLLPLSQEETGGEDSEATPTAQAAGAVAAQAAPNPGPQLSPELLAEAPSRTPLAQWAIYGWVPALFLIALFVLVFAARKRLRR